MATSETSSTKAASSTKPDPKPETTTPAASSGESLEIKVVVPGPTVDEPAPTPGDVVDPRTGGDYSEPTNGYAGSDGFDADGGPSVGVVVGVDPKNIPADVTPGVQPDSGGDKLLAAAQAKAPNLTREFVDSYGLSDEVLAGIARGEISPPPAIGPAHTSDLYLTPGGWQQTAPGVLPGADRAVSRQ